MRPLTIGHYNTLQSEISLLQSGGGGGGGLTAIGDGLLIANISGSSAIPAGNSLSAIIDHDLGNTEGNILYRGASGWVALAPGTSGQILVSGGAGAIPAWSAAGAGLTSIADSNLIANTAGSTAIPIATTLTTFLDHIFGASQGSVLYRGASAWVTITAGSAGQVLTTGGPSANVSWSTPASGNFLGTFTVAALPAAPTAGSEAFASNGRKIGEGAAAGTGCPVYFSTVWRTYSSDQPVAA